MTAHTYRVRFTEWQAFAKDVLADSPEDAIELARAIRDGRGTIDFEELDDGTDAWEAEPIEQTATTAGELLTQVRDAYLSGRTGDLIGLLTGEVCTKLIGKAKGGGQ